MTSLADRALAAHEAKLEETRLLREATEVRIKAEATDAILRVAHEYGVEVTPDDLTRDYNAWQAVIQIDADAHLVLIKRNRDDEVEVRVKPAEQLYWDLPPGQEEKPAGKGGTYGCYGLDVSSMGPIGSLADLGAILVRIREARERWKVRHLP